MSGRWYGAIGRWSDPKGVVQTDEWTRQIDRGVRLTLPEPILRLAQAEYDHQHPLLQDYEQMQERMGLSVLEVIALLADLAERHGAQPTKPRPPSHDTEAGGRGE